MRQFSGGPDAARSWLSASVFHPGSPSVLAKMGIGVTRGNVKIEDTISCSVKSSAEIRIDSQLTAVHVFSSKNSTPIEDSNIDLMSGIMKNNMGTSHPLGGFIAALNRMAKNIDILTKSGLRTCFPEDGSTLSYSELTMDPAWIMPGIKDLLAHLRQFAIARTLEDAGSGEGNPGVAQFILPYVNSGELAAAGIADDGQTRGTLSDILITMANLIRKARFHPHGNSLVNLEHHIANTPLETGRPNTALSWFMNGVFSPLRPNGDRDLQNYGEYVLDLSPLADFLSIEQPRKAVSESWD